MRRSRSNLSHLEVSDVSQKTGRESWAESALRSDESLQYHLITASAGLLVIEEDETAGTPRTRYLSGTDGGRVAALVSTDRVVFVPEEDDPISVPHERVQSVRTGLYADRFEVRTATRELVLFVPDVADWESPAAAGYVLRRRREKRAAGASWLPETEVDLPDACTRAHPQVQESLERAEELTATGQMIPETPDEATRALARAHALTCDVLTRSRSECEHVDSDALRTRIQILEDQIEQLETAKPTLETLRRFLSVRIDTGDDRKHEDPQTALDQITDETGMSGVASREALFEHGQSVRERLRDAEFQTPVLDLYLDVLSDGALPAAAERRRTELLRDIQRIAAEHGHIPSSSEMEQLSTFDQEAYWEFFPDSNWHAVLDAAGIDSRSVLARALARLGEELDHVPSIQETRTASRFAIEEYQSVFEDWTEATQAAGLDLESALVADLQAVNEHVTGPPKSADVADQGRYHPDRYRETFSEWRNALEEANIEAATGHELRQELQRVHEDLDQLPIQQDIVEHSTFAPREFVDRFGSWRAAVDAADIDYESVLKEELERITDHVGQQPTVADIHEHGTYRTAVYNTFYGSLSDARTELGISTDTDETHEDAGDETSQTKESHSREAVLEAIRQLTADLGHRPTIGEMGTHGSMGPIPAFGYFDSWDDAVDAADVDEVLEADETQRQADDPEPEPETAADDQSSREIDPNELAELYDAFGQLRTVLDRILNADRSDQSHGDGSPLSRWYEAVSDRWGGNGPEDAPSYGKQQYERNPFSMPSYRAEYGDEDRITVFDAIDTAPIPEAKREILQRHGIVEADETFAIPVAPGSETPLPIIVETDAAVAAATDLLDEFPSWPAAVEPPEKPNGADDADGLDSYDAGRLDEIEIVVESVDTNVGSRRTASLQVTVGSDMVTFEVWSKHELDVEWREGATYRLRQPLLKEWSRDGTVFHSLSSTKDLNVDRVHSS